MNSSPSSAASSRYHLGIDMAWGERNPDGCCLIHARSDRATIESLHLSHGDDALLELAAALPPDAECTLAVDAPVVCRNPHGSRPVDRESHRVFGHWLCGCHPVNQRLAPRPLRIARQLGQLGFTPGWRGRRILMEVYPHPAIVAWFGLPRRIAYKRGPVRSRRREFARLQRLLRGQLATLAPLLQLDPATRKLLDLPWSKPVEDQTDALLCALIAYWHHRHDGRRSRVLGDLDHGFLVTPAT